jgi:GH25 family lysozyme M1 (1,4-beta-N-acetylmuramidase)
MDHSSGHARKRGLIFLVTAACTSALLLGAPAQADPPPPETDHAMGSQIRKHEGGKVDAKPVPLDSVGGIDVSAHQGTVDWKSWWDKGSRFAYVKATEGTNYTNPSFAAQYGGSLDAGMKHGAYHFALPDRSSGAEQANYFVDHGGGWTPDGRTLPGALDIEYNPYGGTCYGLDPAAMGNWIKDFSQAYQRRTGRQPAIYTSTNWWKQCVSGNFGENPLWVARYADNVGEIPAGWGFHTIWQYTSSPLDQNLFNGGQERLDAFAKG